MKVFLTGASGFIGRSLAARLGERGHGVVCAGRSLPPACVGSCCTVLQPVDFSSDVDAKAWVDGLRGVDVLVNTVGIIRESGTQTFHALHVRAPAALFTAALRAGVRRIVQISALGADEGAQSRYHLSKKAADDVLAAMPVDWVIVKPSLVFGPDGESARLFTTLSSLPFIPLPGRGDYEVQPIYLDDLVEAVVTLVESPSAQRRHVALVGPQALALRNFLAQLRRSLGLGPARFICVPLRVARLLARLASFVRTSPLDPETLDMLLRGNTADAAATRALLGRVPRAASDFIPSGRAAGECLQAQLRWLLPVLRLGIALVWIVSGVVSIFAYPVTEGLALLERAGVPAKIGPAALYGSAVLDIVLGFSCFARRRPPALWVLQAAVILAYTLVITLQLPEYWLHPFGPVLKNLPMLAVIWLIYELERRQWNT